MYCENCGVQLPDGTTVCTACGAVMTVAQPQQQAPPPQQQVPYQQAPGAPEQRAPQSKTVVGLLGIFLGMFGVHNFLLGNKNRAILQLCLSVGGLIFCWLFIPAILPFAMGIWGLVEGIQVLAGTITTDAYGIPLKD